MQYNGKDIYEGKIVAENDGIFAISLVEYPAVERDFVCFKENVPGERQLFSIENADKQLITGVVMLADTPIYRRNGDYEYYITYSKETIEKMANKLLRDGFQNAVDLQHDGVLIPGVTMTELYIKDSSKGINPNFFEDIPDGSLIATFYIEDEELWEEIKNGDKLNGFSLEGFFTIEKIKQNKNTTMSKITKFMKSLMKFGQVETDKAVLYYDGETLEVGVEVYVDGEEDIKVLAEDGEYKTEDTTIVVVDGKVSEIITDTKEDEVVEEVFSKRKQLFEESYQEKEIKIAKAIHEKGFDGWVVEAGDDFAIIELYNGDEYKKYKFPITWEGEEAVAGDPIEVVEEYVPVSEEVVAPGAEETFSDETEDIVSKEDKLTSLETEIGLLKVEIEAIKELVKKISEEPVSEPIVEEFEAVGKKKESKMTKAARLLSHFNAK